MDLHIIPGVKAKEAAEAHQQDLLLQDEFGCTCMTYWIDEPKNSIFCLIEAPNAQAVKDLHNKAHGNTPHKIIHVNKTIVESFLGRVYDPHVDSVQETQLKIFNDPAFRILVLIDILEPVLLEINPMIQSMDLLKKFRECIACKALEFGGEITSHNENLYQILSFTSPQNAVTFAISIKNNFSTEERRLLNLHIIINSGVPVENSLRLFGDTLDLGKALNFTATPENIVMASFVKKLFNQDQLHPIKSQLQILTTAEEKILKDVISILEQNINNENFGIDDFAKQLGQSKSGLNRSIHAFTGKSPVILIKEFRLKTALELLKENNTPASDAAYKTGFGSPSYFSKCFKEHYGIAPSYFIEKYRK